MPRLIHDLATLYYLKQVSIFEWTRTNHVLFGYGGWVEAVGKRSLRANPRTVIAKALREGASSRQDLLDALRVCRPRNPERLLDRHLSGASSLYKRGSKPYDRR